MNLGDVPNMIKGVMNYYVHEGGIYLNLCLDCHHLPASQNSSGRIIVVASLKGKWTARDKKITNVSDW